jgi:hypothetical protein
MGKLLRTYPPRMLDALYRTQTYLDRRRGMVDPEADRRIERSELLNPLPVTEKQASEITIWGSTNYNTGTVGGFTSVSQPFTLNGIDGSGSWVCSCGWEVLPVRWQLTCNASAANTIRANFYNGDPSGVAPSGAGKLKFRCSKQT